MLNPFTRQPITLSLLPCFALGTLGWLSAAHGQANVTVTAGTAVANSGVTTSVNGSTTATFNEITPASFYGTNGTSANPTSSYTSPTTLTNASTYGTVTIAGITPATASAVGSFVSGSSSGAYGTPTNDTSTYVAIGGSARPGPLTLTFSNAGTNYFGLDWASPDSYNSVMLTFANGATATYTPGTTNGGFNLAANASDSFVNFYSTTPSNAITQVQLSSSSAAFELDNVAFGVVPEPATWLGGLGLVGAAGLTLRRRSCVRA